MGNAFAESVLRTSTHDHAHSARGGRVSGCVNTHIILFVGRSTSIMLKELNKK